MSQQSEQEPETSFQVAIREHTDIRRPAPGFVAALAEQFAHAASQAQGRMCLSVPGAKDGDGTPAAIESVLKAAAALRKTSAGAPVAVAMGEARYTADGYCHVLARCQVGADAELQPA